jgi:hypothetical protein
VAHTYFFCDFCDFFLLCRNSALLSIIFAPQNETNQNLINMDTNKFEQLTDYTSAGYALAKDLLNGRICVMEGDCAIYTTEYEDLWYEYPKGTWQCPLVWAAPDRLAFFRNGYWGLRDPEGLIVIPDEFQIIVNYKGSGYFILRDKAGRVGCVDKDFNCIFPCAYDWVPIRKKVDQLIANPKD